MSGPLSKSHALIPGKKPCDPWRLPDADSTERKAARYTQQQLADEIDATHGMMAYYESESKDPLANMVVDLARALHLMRIILTRR